jgi:hypothetical protein
MSAAFRPVGATGAAGTRLRDVRPTRAIGWMFAACEIRTGLDHIRTGLDEQAFPITEIGNSAPQTPREITVPPGVK